MDVIVTPIIHHLEGIGRKTAMGSRPVWTTKLDTISKIQITTKPKDLGLKCRTVFAELKLSKCVTNLNESQGFLPTSDECGFLLPLFFYNRRKSDRSDCGRSSQ